ncbi:hypothetical protein [Xanthomonas euvesicatoria]|uniref:Uncharacterized protein n=1 Tax=Xanthomonas euvesicatoria TaxID=456327 RepID=A0AAW3U1N3_XANEU|nr:hypothetical protein [Xanthomonas euvesicatoria]MBB4722955.1 hypothetical protein [Xanthomonas euvesicatoria]MBB4869548.1 hypothetical protein [Xanthomonas euvesicatoria]
MNTSQPHDPHPRLAPSPGKTASRLPHIRTLHLQHIGNLRQRASPSPTMRVHAGHLAKPALALQSLRVDIRHLARTKHF